MSFLIRQLFPIKILKFIISHVHPKSIPNYVIYKIELFLIFHMWLTARSSCISDFWYKIWKCFSIRCLNQIISPKTLSRQVTFYILWITNYTSTSIFKTQTSYSSFTLTTFLSKCKNIWRLFLHIVRKVLFLFFKYSFYLSNAKIFKVWITYLNVLFLFFILEFQSSRVKSKLSFFNLMLTSCSLSWQLGKALFYILMEEFCLFNLFSS